MSAPRLNFDRIAQPYRVLERITMGRALERVRLRFLPEMMAAERALVLGDGDGRFLACLLAENRCIHATAVDVSATMLSLLRRRCSTSDRRLRTHHGDALSYCRSSDRGYDLVVTHFFLDCLTQQQADELAMRVAQIVDPGAVWVISDFCIPRGAMRLPARALVRGLYLAFRLLTHLSVTQLPDHAAALTRAGFVRLQRDESLAGILSAERWGFQGERTRDETTRISDGRGI
jgi:ubiquinone/menaquinone biosynthesis C-methylase UbiE